MALATVGHAHALALGLALVGVSVLLGAVLEPAPPLLVQKVVDEHLALGRAEGLLWIAACTWVLPRQCRAWGF
jgi:hypothetical protein